MSELTPTPVTDPTYQYLAKRVIAFCAAYVDVNYDPKAVPAINTDELIAAVCKHFGIRGRDMQEAYEMREGVIDLLESKKTAPNAQGGPNA